MPGGETQIEEPQHLGAEAERGRVNHTQRAGVPATTQRFKDNFESLETDGGIKQPVLLLSNHCHMCWGGRGRETLVKEQTHQASASTRK